jgi:hypothetical protein
MSGIAAQRSSNIWLTSQPEQADRYVAKGRQLGVVIVLFQGDDEGLPFRSYVYSSLRLRQGQLGVIVTLP